MNKTQPIGSNCYLTQMVITVIYLGNFAQHSNNVSGCTRPS